MGATCSRRVISYILTGKNGDEGAASGCDRAGQHVLSGTNVTAVPLSSKARRLSIDKRKDETASARGQESPRPGVPLLLDACVSHFARCPDRLDAATLDLIPNELIQMIFDVLVETHRLDAEVVSLFAGRSICNANLASQPGVTDDWLRALCGLELSVLQVSGEGRESRHGRAHTADALLSLLRHQISHCRQITDKGLGQLHLCPSLTSLSLDCCFGVTAEGLRALETLTELRTLSLESCECIGETKLGFLRGMTELRELSLDMCR